MLRAIIVDDIDFARQQIMDVIADYCPQIKIIGEANSVFSAVSMINTSAPDLVFLDIELGDGTGFDVLKQIDTSKIKVIFVTAHESYAIKAFRCSATDYLLKPVDSQELEEAVNKAQEVLQNEMLKLSLNALYQNIQSPNELKKMIIKTTDKIFSIDIENIIRCESDTNYTTFYLQNGQKITASVTLKEYDDMLCKQGFYRVHRTHLINIKHFSHFVKNDGYIVMNDKSEVPVATRKKEPFIAFLEKMQ